MHGVGTPENPPPGPDKRRATVVARARDLLPLAQDVPSVGGPFQADALLTLADLYHTAAQPAAGHQASAPIALTKFPSARRGDARPAPAPTTSRPTSKAVDHQPRSGLPPGAATASTTVTRSDEKDSEPDGSAAVDHARRRLRPGGTTSRARNWYGRLGVSSHGSERKARFRPAPTRSRTPWPRTLREPGRLWLLRQRRAASFLG